MPFLGLLVVRLLKFIFLILSLAAPASFGQVLLQKAKPTNGSALGFLVVGTIAQKTADNNVALVKVIASGSVTAVKIGHVIDGKYKVTDINEKFIRVITRDAKHWLVFLEKFAGEFTVSDNSGPMAVIDPNGTYKEDGFERNSGKVTMTSAYRDRIVNQDMSKILMQATAEPFMQNGVIVGFKIYQIDSDSIFAKGGLRDEDVITSINNQKLTSVAGAIGLLKGLKEVPSIEVEVLRGGAPTTMTISVN